MDIIHGLIMKYDLASTRIGLKAVTDQVIKNNGLNNKGKISKRFCNHFYLVGKLAARIEDEESTAEVIENLENFAKVAVEKKVGIATAQAAKSIRMVAIVAAKNKLEDATSLAADSLGNIGISAAKEEGFAGGRRQAAGVTTQTLVSLERVGRVAAKNELDGAVKRVVFSLLRLAITVIERDFKLQPHDAAKSLAALAFLNKEIVNKAFQEFKFNLMVKGVNDEDRKAFGEFAVLYDKELEELRKEKEKKNAEE